MIVQEIHRDLDLNTGVYQEPLREAFLMGDQQAHRFVIHVMRGTVGHKVELTATGVTGYFMRADGTTVIAEGETDSNRAIVQLPAACYAVPGRFSLVIKLSRAEVVETVAYFTGSIARSRTDEMIDPDETIPTLDELLGRIAALETVTDEATEIVLRAEEAAAEIAAKTAEATTAAQHATEKANEAEEAASASKTSANRAVAASGDAESSANSAQTYAVRSERAADRAENIINSGVPPERIAEAVENYLTQNPVVVEENDPTVPAWAKQPTKPTYTAAEVGAQPAGDYALAADVNAALGAYIDDVDTLIGGVD